VIAAGLPSRVGDGLGDPRGLEKDGESAKATIGESYNRRKLHECLRGALSRQSDTGHEETTDHRVANLSKTAQKRVADLQSAILISHGIWRYVLGAIRYASDCRVPPVRLLRVAEVDDFAGTRSHLPNEVYDGLSGLKDMSALHDDVGGIGTECTPLTPECCGFSTLM
jgi:hypothetical protein